jgi:hypothetical protein
MISTQPLTIPAAGMDVVAFNGWPNNLRMRNGTVELIITLDVGPRILSYKKVGGFGPGSLDTNSEEALDELVRPILEECEQPG